MYRLCTKKMTALVGAVLMSLMSGCSDIVDPHELTGTWESTCNQESHSVTSDLIGTVSFASTKNIIEVDYTGTHISWSHITYIDTECVVEIGSVIYAGPFTISDKVSLPDGNSAYKTDIKYSHNLIDYGASVLFAINSFNLMGVETVDENTSYLILGNITDDKNGTVSTARPTVLSTQSKYRYLQTKKPEEGSSFFGL